MVHFLRLSVVLVVFIFHCQAADPPFLFPHGYFDSAKLKPFDAIYLNLMAQSNLEYGGVTLEDLDQLDKSRKVVARPTDLPRTRVEDDVFLDREPLPLDTGKYAIAPGPKQPQQEGGRTPFSSIANGMSPSGAHDGEAKLKTVDRPLSAFTMTAAEAKSDIPHAKPMAKGNNQLRRGSEKRPPSPFRLIRRLQRRDRRAVADDVNPFEEIATRAPPRDEVQMQRLRYYIRRQRKPKKKRRRNFLTRNDIYDPQRNQRARMTNEERKKLREELALKPTSDEAEEGSAVKTKETLESTFPEEQPDPTTRRALHTGGRISQKDPRTTPEPIPLPTLIPTMDRLPRLPNNPFRSFDISKPTVIALPIPPFIEEEFEGRE